MKMLNLLLIGLSLALVGCGTSDAALQDQGKSESYIQGFHDGRHSGMSEQGNRYEHYIRDEGRFNASVEYKRGWLDGENEGKKLQREAVSVGNALGGAYSASQISKEADKSSDADRAAQQAMEGVDTSGLESLGED